MLSALAKTAGAGAVVLVEGVSDHIGVETVAARRDADRGETTDAAPREAIAA
jgi:hypothetical protein